MNQEVVQRMATRQGRKIDVRNGMTVYSSDGVKLGRVREVRSPEVEEKEPVSPFRPLPDTTPVFGDRVDLDITGALEPLAREQPTQAELGVRPGETTQMDNRIEGVAAEDVGADYKEQGETLDTRLPGELGDPRVADGYFRMATGLDSADMYVPLSAVSHVTREGRLVLRLTREELNNSGWGAKPAETGARSLGATGRGGSLLNRIFGRNS